MCISARRGCLCVPLRVTRSNMMIILSSIGVLILLPSCGSCTAVAAAGIGCQGTICCWACSCCIKPRGQLTLEDGLPHVRAPMLKPPMLPTPNLLDLRRLGMPALKPPEACSPMLHPMLPMPELRGLGMPALIQPAVCPPSPVPLISCLISRIGMSAIIPPRVCTPDS